MASKSIADESDGLHNLFWDVIKSKQDKNLSAIGKILFLLKEFNILLPSQPHKRSSTFTKIKVDTSLASWNKAQTNPALFKCLVKEKIQDFSPELVLYTDGSFQNGITSYAVIQFAAGQECLKIKQSILPPFSGIFSAEVAAINTAVNYTAQKDKKTVICTDSLSAVKAIQHNTTSLYNHIRNIAVSKPILLLWIPSHIGIEGNELADKYAKEATKMVLITEVPCLPQVITNPFKTFLLDKLQHEWQNSGNFLRRHNSYLNRPLYHEQYSRIQCIMLARLRVGKALFNTQHYYNNSNPLMCRNCHHVMSISHILEDCPISKQDKPLAILLDCSKPKNLMKIQRSFQRHSIQMSQI